MAMKFVYGTINSPDGAFHSNLEYSPKWYLQFTNKKGREIVVPARPALLLANLIAAVPLALKILLKLH